MQQEPKTPGEFPTTLTYAAGSAEGCALRVRANREARQRQLARQR